MIPPTATNPPDMSDSQERLKRILGSVRLEKSSEKDSASQTTSDGCPQCGSTTDWGKRSWCQDCHYSRQLGREITEQEIAASLISRPPAGPRQNHFRTALPFILGIGLPIGIGTLLQLTGSSRADEILQGRCLFGGGLLLILAAHAQAYLFVFRSQHQQSVNHLERVSIFRPTSLWWELFRQFPNSRNSIALALSGVINLLMATAVGVDFHSLSQTIADRASGSRLFAREFDREKTQPAVIPLHPISEEEAPTPSPLSSRIPQTQNDDERSNQGKFHILGYLANPQGAIRTILVASLEDNRGRFVGRVPVEGLSDQQQIELQRLLDRHRTPNAPLRLGFQARWVRPTVTCTVAFVDWTPLGMLQDGYLISYQPAPPPAFLVQLPTAESSPTNAVTTE